MWGNKQCCFSIIWMCWKHLKSPTKESKTIKSQSRGHFLPVWLRQVSELGSVMKDWFEKQVADQTCALHWHVMFPLTVFELAFLLRFRPTLRSYCKRSVPCGRQWCHRRCQERLVSLEKLCNYQRLVVSGQQCNKLLRLHFHSVMDANGTLLLLSWFQNVSHLSSEQQEASTVHWPSHPVHVSESSPVIQPVRD